MTALLQSGGEDCAGIACDRPIQEARLASLKKLSGKSEQETSVFRAYRKPDFKKWRRDDLYHLAQQQGIENRANMSNEELAQALSHARSGAP